MASSATLRLTVGWAHKDSVFSFLRCSFLGPAVSVSCGDSASSTKPRLGVWASRLTSGCQPYPVGKLRKSDMRKALHTEPGQNIGCFLLNPSTGNQMRCRLSCFSVTAMILSTRTSSLDQGSLTPGATDAIRWGSLGRRERGGTAGGGPAGKLHLHLQPLWGLASPASLHLRASPGMRFS